MGIKEVSEGKYLIRWQRGSGKTRKFSTRTFYGTREQAQALYEELNEGSPPARKPPLRRHTLSSFAPDYLRHCAAHKDAKGKRDMVSLLLREFGDHALSAINIRLLEAYQSEMATRNLSNATINRRIGCIKHMLRKAVDWEMCPPSVTQSLSRVRMKKEPLTRLRFLTQQEADRLITACGKSATLAPWLTPIVAFALNTGARLSEILKLSWNNVDLRTGLVTFVDTKNGERRDVPINDTLRHVLTALVRPLDGQERVFRPDGKEGLKRINRSFCTALRRAGIGGGVVFHTLRHIFASNLVMRGVDLKTVQELLGHKSLAMTMRYAHLSPEHKAAAVRVLDRKEATE